MAIIKCKMCGGDLNLIEGVSTAECEFCGSIQTIPKVDDEKKLTLFARANRLRAACEFDKAAGIYESVVADFPEEAEAYWGLVLCKYGIEYVDDPATGKKIPTCHRSSFDSVMEDSDFEQALENADGTARKVYREEAKQIEELRKGIIAVSSNERPYDIFICYKETAENGDRTLDSVLAQDVYDALTDKGYRVFFSRITLEDKLGMEYEPYIFAALNSAKIMLVFGTDYEYFNAVWVKNEWSRFLKLMAKDKEKHMIPCFKGIDAYDLPKEFARLQAQDLGKVGAVQDLLRGIEKLLPKRFNAAVVQETVVVGGAGNNKVASLLDRGNMALEDGDWAKADSFFEDVLNNDSKNAQAYLGKTLAQEKCRTIDAFVRKRKDASKHGQMEILTVPANTTHIEEMVTQYSLPGYVGQDDIRKLYDFERHYSSAVSGRRQQYTAEQRYWQEHKLLSRAEKFAMGAVAESLQREKRALFAALKERIKQAEAAEAMEKAKVQTAYDAHMAQADKKAEYLYRNGLNRREEHYQLLLQIAKNENDVNKLRQTAAGFLEFGDYKDSANLAVHCRRRAEEEQAKLDEEAERQRVRRERQAKARKVRNQRITIAVSIVVILIITGVVFITQFFVPNQQYKKAESMLSNGQYEAAIAAFVELDDFSNSKEMVQECYYLRAISLFEAGKYSEALQEFTELGSYKDSQNKILECINATKDESYDAAVALMNAGKYEDAILLFESLNGHRDSVDMIQACETLILDARYENAVSLMTAGKYEEAIAEFTALKGHRDSESKIVDCNNAIKDEKYYTAIDLMKKGKYSEAIEIFKKLYYHRDSIEKIKECEAGIREDQYQNAVLMMNEGKYREALSEFKKLIDYKESEAHIQTCVSKITVVVEVSTAQELLENIGSYKVIVLVSDRYNLSSVSSIKNAHVEKSAINSSYIFKNVEYLTIMGDASIVIDDRWADVLSFSSCNNITLSGITVGHTKLYEEYSCDGAVVCLRNCNTVKIDDCNLFGCGAVGLSCYGSKNVSLTNSNIYECSLAGISMNNSQVVVENCDFHDFKIDDYGALVISYGSTATFVKCKIRKVVAKCLIEVDNNSSLTFQSCTIKNNQYTTLTTNAAKVKFDNCTIE